MAPNHDVRADQIKQTRRAILDCLNMVYPSVISFDTLKSALAYLLVDDAYIRKDLYYLKQKGYLEVDFPKWDRANMHYRLTGEGKEQADRINADPALEP